MDISVHVSSMTEEEADAWLVSLMAWIDKNHPHLKDRPSALSSVQITLRAMNDKKYRIDHE